MRRIAIVGGSLAGVHAAEMLREAGYQEEIHLVSAEAVLPYDRPPLSKEALSAGVDAEKLLLREPGWYTDKQITVHLGSPAVSLDTGGRQLLLADGQVLGYDGLVLATGSRARTLPDQPSTRVLRTVADAAALREELSPGRHLVIIGGGFIGLEVAATARQLGVEVTVVEVGRVPLSRALGEEVGEWFRDLHARNDITVLCACSLETIQPTSAGARVRLTDGREFAADVVVAGVGAEPVTEWLESSGIVLANGVRCGADLATSVPGIVAAGDVARWYNPLFDEEMRVEHWTNAVEQGRHAATTLLGERQAYAPVPYFWSDQHEARIRFVGRVEAASQVVITEQSDTTLVALYGRDGVVRGALCVNAPRQLAKLRTAIKEQVAWEDVIAPSQVP